MVKNSFGKVLVLASCSLVLVACSSSEPKQEEVDNNFNVGMNTGNAFNNSNTDKTQEAYNNPLIDEEDPYLGLSFSMDTGESQRAGWYYQIKIGRDGAGNVHVAEFDYVNDAGELYSEVAEDRDKFKDRSNRYTKYLIEKQNLDNFFSDLGVDKDKASDGKTFYHAYVGDEQSTAYTDVYEGYLTNQLESAEGGNNEESNVNIIPGAHEANLQAGQELIGPSSSGGTKIKIQNGTAGFYEGSD